MFINKRPSVLKFQNDIFRNLLEEEEASIDQLESKLDKILKVCGSMIDAGKAYVGQQRFVTIILIALITFKSLK